MRGRRSKIVNPTIKLQEQSQTETKAANKSQKREYSPSFDQSQAYDEKFKDNSISSQQQFGMLKGKKLKKSTNKAKNSSRKRKKTLDKNKKQISLQNNSLKEVTSIKQQFKFQESLQSIRSKDSINKIKIQGSNMKQEQQIQEQPKEPKNQRIRFVLKNYEPQNLELAESKVKLQQSRIKEQQSEENIQTQVNTKQQKRGRKKGRKTKKDKENQPKKQQQQNEQKIQHQIPTNNFNILKQQNINQNMNKTGQYQQPFQNYYLVDFYVDTIPIKYTTVQMENQPKKKGRSKSKEQTFYGTQREIVYVFQEILSQSVQRSSIQQESGRQNNGTRWGLGNSMMKQQGQKGKNRNILELKVDQFVKNHHLFLQVIKFYQKNGVQMMMIEA